VPGLEEPSRYLARPVTGGSTRYVLVTGSSQHHRVETLASLRRQFLVGVPVVLVMATIAGYFLAGLSLRPVESMRRRAASISAETAGERLPIAPTRDELERLGETLNAMLERLDTALQREREFVADAGHELRTPLTLLRTELELALRHGTSAEDLREAVRRSAEEVERLAQLADGLLLIARADRGTLDLRLEEIDASELLTSVGSRFDWRVEEAGRQFSAGADSALRIPGDRLRLEQALSNMVDNALRHGRGAVHLTAARADGFVELHVTDEGDGFPPEFVGQAFERFARADQARTRGGSGLGLAIVRTIAEAHGGSAHAANAERGGADVWVSVPSGAYRR
jgi:signal transduction histidine kinase